MYHEVCVPPIQDKMSLCFNLSGSAKPRPLFYIHFSIQELPFIFDPRDESQSRRVETLPFLVAMHCPQCDSVRDVSSYLQVTKPLAIDRENDISGSWFDDHNYLSNLCFMPDLRFT